MVTFSDSPAKYFGKDIQYIYSREHNYRLIEKLGIDYIYEQDFSKISTLNAEEYLSGLVNKFKPKYITAGFNHTFGAKKQGNYKLLNEWQKKYNYKYLCIQPHKINDKIVSSTEIKNSLNNGDIEKANLLLTRPFSISSTVIKGAQLGRKLGFPTANLKYPQDIIKIPYGVYKIRVLNKIAVMNWGIKPTIGSEEIIEIHIPNFQDNLYDQNLEIEILNKIRNEIKFNSLEELKVQIEKDVKECLK